MLERQGKDRPCEQQRHHAEGDAVTGTGGMAVAFVCAARVFMPTA